MVIINTVLQHETNVSKAVFIGEAMGTFARNVKFWYINGAISSTWPWCTRLHVTIFKFFIGGIEIWFTEGNKCKYDFICKTKKNVFPKLINIIFTYQKCIPDYF